MAGSGNAWFSTERVVALDELDTEEPTGCNGFKRGSEDVDGCLFVMEVFGSRFEVAIHEIYMRFQLRPVTYLIVRLWLFDLQTQDKPYRVFGIKTHLKRSRQQ